MTDLGGKSPAMAKLAQSGPKKTSFFFSQTQLALLKNPIYPQLFDHLTKKFVFESQPSADFQRQTSTLDGQMIGGIKDHEKCFGATLMQFCQY